MGKKHLSVTLENVDALDVLHASFHVVDVEGWTSPLAVFDVINASKRKSFDKPIRSVPTRIAQKSTVRVSDDCFPNVPEKEGDVVVIGAGHTKGATSTFKSARDEGGADYAALLLNALFPSEAALCAGVLAQADGIDWSVVAPDNKGSLNKLTEALAELADALYFVESDKLPDGKAKAEDYGGAGVSEDYVASVVSRFGKSSKKASDKKASDSKKEYSKAQVDELAQVKYIGESTARALLEQGWTWSKMKTQSTMNGPEHVLEQVSTIVGSRALNELEALLPEQV